MKRNVLSYSVAIGLGACALVLLVVMSLMPSGTNVNGVTISPSDSVLAPSTNSGPVLFVIKNAEPFMVHLGHLEVQVPSSNGWKTISEEWSPMLSPSLPGPTPQWAGTLLAGSHRACRVQPPQGPWRVRLTYLRQKRGLFAALGGRARFAVAKHSWAPFWSGNVSSFYREQHQVMSQEFSQ